MVIENSKRPFLKVKDYSVSGEYFDLLENSEYGFLETIPQPSLDSLPDYYKSEDYISHTNSRRNLFEKVYHWARHGGLASEDYLFPISQARRPRLAGDD